MKIMQVITLSELGGAQSVVANLSNYLSKDHELIVVAGEGDGKLWSMLNQGITQEPCTHLRRALSPLHDCMTLLFFLRLYWKYKPDIIHLHSSKAGMLGRMVFPSKKIVYTVHGFDSIRLAYPKFLPIERFMQRFCKAIVGVSQYDEKCLREEGIVHNVSYVFNGIYKPSKEGSLSFGIPTHYKKTILSIARVSRQKRHDLFIEVAKLLPEYAFVWIGNQMDVPDVPENAYFLGNISDAGAYCELADLFMLPSNYEGLPMVILEAMSFGKPVVASDVGGIHEVVKNGENGYTVENDPACFAEKIQSILENEAVYSSFSACALECFERDFKVDKMAERYLNIYTK